METSVMGAMGAVAVVGGADEKASTGVDQAGGGGGEGEGEEREGTRGGRGGVRARYGITSHEVTHILTNLHWCAL